MNNRKTRRTRHQVVAAIRTTRTTTASASAAQTILAGVPLKSFDRAQKDCLLVAVTEKRTRGEIDAYAAALTAAVA